MTPAFWWSRSAGNVIAVSVDPAWKAEVTSGVGTITGPRTHYISFIHLHWQRLVFIKSGLPWHNVTSSFQGHSWWRKGHSIPETCTCGRALRSSWTCIFSGRMLTFLNPGWFVWHQCVNVKCKVQWESLYEDSSKMRNICTCFASLNCQHVHQVCIVL